MSTQQHVSRSFAAIPPMARVFLAMLERIKVGHLSLITPDGERMLFGDARHEPWAIVTLHDWRACGRILSAGDIGFAEAYRQGWIDSPDLTSLLRLALQNEAALRSAITGGWLSQLWYNLLHRLRPNSRRGSRRNIHAHYDIGNAFYQRWLDESWTYSSAIFEDDRQRSLPAAQAAKYQRIVDTLGLHAGMKVLEVGCGWGGFAEHAARLGIAVHGITISPSQLEIARQRVAQAGLEQLATLELRDYRDLSGEYDAIVSIEMFEAVGEQYWDGYFETLRRCLKPGGKALVQSITLCESRFLSYRRSSDFIREFIFLGGMLPSPERFAAHAARRGLSLRSQYAFGHDYAETLRRWRANFEDQLEAIRNQGFDETFIRTWRLYFTYCEAGFDEERTDVVQFELQRRD
ncbi:SAM-dependent methyltransferase [Parachitinimonas caeni]|uniref:Cyclopropane-fatty-acyl-phospholipid synthase n=1 Tax=Parachitinimonas caeni TaxID=3031301 RepID=A0ABT7DXD5_9NEIS|nr:cyclopropane-fatty-acyl-phospholipid synthase family protein [Parachitinimonas caeni]MDK2124732.1 cyclopropane-fatty-acyl-phospholipid synthase [Parachitinimonas caeni]